MEVLQRGEEFLYNGKIGADMDGRGNDIVAALPHIDVIVWVNAASKGTGRQGSDHFIGVHVCTGAGAGLENVEREMGVVGAVGDIGAGVLNRRRHFGINLT